MWDWADGEKDDDPTKSYPFPVPRIRDLSSEFAMPSCNPDVNSSPELGVEDEEDSNAVPVHNNSEVPLMDEESMASQKPTRNDDKSENHLFSHSDSFQVVHMHKPKKRHTTYHLTNNDKNNTLNVPRRSAAYRRSPRHFTYVKSIVADPPDATQDDVYKARFKLQSKDHIQALQV